MAFHVLTAALALCSQETVQKEFVYKKTPQGELKIHVTFPPGWKDTDRRPGIVFFFGGGWSKGDVKQFAPQADYLASRGMVAARTDYRVKTRHQVSPDACVEDAKSAVRWIRAGAASLGVDPDRIVAAGGSAGGHLAACTAVVEGFEAAGEDAGISSRPNALVLFNPAVDLASMAAPLGLSEETARQITPTLHLRKELPPALVLFGTNDRLLEAGRTFVEKSRALENRAELYLADGQGHGFFNKAPWQERTLYRTDEFLGSLGYLQGPPTLKLPPAER